LLGGRCKECGESISERYPIVELLSGAVWLLAGVRFGATLTCAAAIVFFYTLLLLAFIDWDTMRLPNPLTLSLGAVGYLAATVAAVTGHAIVPLSPGTGWLANPLLSGVVGSVAGVAFTVGIALAYRLVRKMEGFGLGDVKLLAAMGPYLGLYVLMALFFGSVMGAVYGVTSMRAGRLGLRTKFPFGPFLAIAAVIVAVSGPGIWTWYTGLIHAL
jgi:leader peptidase (prepilin peptidase)/N-methyltransferase